MDHRIVSLLPSSTEIVCALGFEKYLVGRSHECDYPESVKSLPICSEPKIQLDGRSYDIDQRITAVLEDSLSVYHIHADVLKELKPDVIITQSQCEVCAVSEKELVQIVQNELDSRPEVVSLNPISLESIWKDIIKVGEAISSKENGEELVERLKFRMLSIKEQRNRSNGNPRVASVEWLDPVMAGGNWMPELIEMAGGKNLFGEAGIHSPRIQWNDIIDVNPDVILVLPCGYGISKTMSEIPRFKDNPGWDSLKAVRDDQVFILDGNQYFNRPGPRVVESLEILAEILNPRMFDFGHENTGWIKL